jgi:hypothetical protein
LAEIELDAIAEDVFVILDSINVQDCWNWSGRSRDGYTSPDEAVDEIIAEELQPFFEQIERYHQLGMPIRRRPIAWAYFSASTATRESPSRSSGNGRSIFPANSLACCWTSGTNAIKRALHNFIHERCPQWGKWLQDQKL